MAMTCPLLSDGDKPWDWFGEGLSDSEPDEYLEPRELCVKCRERVAQVYSVQERGLIRYLCWRCHNEGFSGHYYLEQEHSAKSARVIFLEGPYGVGKTTLAQKIRDADPDRVEVADEGFLGDGFVRAPLVPENGVINGISWAAALLTRVLEAAMRKPIVVVDTSPIAMVVYRKGLVGLEVARAMLEELRAQVRSVEIFVLDLPSEVRETRVRERFVAAPPAEQMKRRMLGELRLPHFNAVEELYLNITQHWLAGGIPLSILACDYPLDLSMFLT